MPSTDDASPPGARTGVAEAPLVSAPAPTGRDRARGTERAGGTERPASWPAASLRRVLPLLGYLAVAFGFTLHAWADPAHSWTGGPGDSFQFMSFLAWTPHAIAAHHNPLFMSALDYPRGVNLTWNTAMPLAGVAVWPITAVFGPVIAYNTVVVAAITLDGWCTFLWLRRHTRSLGAAFAGGLLLALGPFIPAHLTQPSLLSFWPVPLMLIVTERLVDDTRRAPLWGLLLGFLAAVQLYLASELVALGAILIAVMLVVAALLDLRAARQRLLGVAAAVGAAAVVFALLASPFILYQLRGPYAIRGPIQPPNTYVADVQNVFVPTALTWLWPHGATQTLVDSWTGTAEATAYIGIPLTLVAIYALVRWRRERLVLTAFITAAVMLVLSLGPRLHIGGGVSSGIPLPAAILGHVPLLDKMLPVRFALMAYFGLALLLALTLDRTLFAAPPRSRLAAALAVVATLSTVSVVALPASTAAIPQYFRSGGEAGELPAGTVALVGPYIDDGGATAVPMLWQAQADFRFALIEGLVITGDDQGHPLWILDNPVRAAFHQIQVDGTAPDETPALRTSLLDLLRRDRVTAVILGPMDHQEVASVFVSWLLGSAPRSTQGVLVWQSVPSAAS